MTRGPTRRVRRLHESGQLSEELLAAAAREADLLEHPYVGVEHLQLARLRLAGNDTEREALRRQLAVGVPQRWWRPRGPHSALRRRGIEETRAARRTAEQEER